jgi:hypothetical protein
MRRILDPGDEVGARAEFEWCRAATLDCETRDGLPVRTSGILCSGGGRKSVDGL